MAAGSPTTSDVAAARRYGPLLDQLAQQYTNPVNGKPLSGAALLLKLAKGESGFDSSANSGKAQGRTQFTPGSRAEVLRITGGKVDPLRSTDEAYHATALHLLGKVNGKTGLAGYNPGMPSYTDYILGQKVGAGAGGGGAPVSGATGAQGGSGAPGASAAGTAGAEALLASMQGQQRPRSVGLAAPAFSAHPTLAGGAQIPVGGMGPQRGGGVDALLGAAAAAQGQGAPAQSAGPAASASSVGGAAMGRVVVDPGANRPGQGLTPGIERVARIIAGVHGTPIHVGTGTAHSLMTASGNVSDHASGNAFDAPARGQQLTSMATDALLATGDGKTVQWLRNDGSVQSVRVTRENAQQLAAAGGIFNVPYGKARRIQVIANTHQGGDHTNHLHVGVTPLAGKR